jgi:hypothetical protein
MTLTGAIKQLHELRSAEDMPIYYKPVVAEVINVLLLDTQEVKHGRWIKMIGENGVTDAISCSICGFEDNRYELFNYCPRCGAKMGEAK